MRRFAGQEVVIDNRSRLAPDRPRRGHTRHHRRFDGRSVETLTYLLAGQDQIAEPGLIRIQTISRSARRRHGAALCPIDVGADKLTVQACGSGPIRACYQGIIEADTKVLAVRSVKSTSTPYTLELQSYASIPLHDQFGIQEGVQDAGHGIVVDFDFSISLGREVCKAT